MNYSERIYELRRKEGISQEALALEIGTTRQQVSRWECGAAIPSSKYVYALAKHFNCSVDEIFGEGIMAEESDTEDRSAFYFKNIALAFVIALLINYLLAVLLSYFSGQLAGYLLQMMSATRDGGAQQDASTVNSAAANIRELICQIALVYVVVSSFILLLAGSILFSQHMKTTKSKIIRAEFLSSFLSILLMVISTTVAGGLYLSVGQHVSFLGAWTFGLFDGTLFFFGAFFAADVFITLFRILLHKPLSKRLVLKPWNGAVKVFEIVFVALGVPLFVVFVIFGSASYPAFWFFGIIYFSLSFILTVAHLFVCYRPFGK